MLLFKPDSDTESDVDSTTLDKEHVIVPVTSQIESRVNVINSDVTDASDVNVGQQNREETTGLPPKRPNTATRIPLVKHNQAPSKS